MINIERLIRSVFMLCHMFFSLLLSSEGELITYCLLYACECFCGLVVHVCARVSEQVCARCR